MRLARALSLITALILVLSLANGYLVCSELTVFKYSIFIEGLHALVTITLDVDEGFYLIPYVGEVIGFVKVNNSEVVAGVSSDGIMIYSPKHLIIHVNYTSLIASVENGVLVVNTSLPFTYEVILRKGLIPVNVSGSIQSFSLVNDEIVIVFNGSGYLELIDVSNASVTTTPTESITTPPTQWVFVVIAILLTLVAIGLLIWKTRSRALMEYLDDRDKLIINTLRERGDLTASELIKYTGIPRSAIYRRLKRLIKLGYIEQVKLGVKTVYRLKRR